MEKDKKVIYRDGYDININLENIKRKKLELTRLQKILGIVTLSALTIQAPIMYNLYNNYQNSVKKENIAKYKLIRDKKYKFINKKVKVETKLALKK